MVGALMVAGWFRVKALDLFFGLPGYRWRH